MQLFQFCDPFLSSRERLTVSVYTEKAIIFKSHYRSHHIIFRGIGKLKINAVDFK
jgi:hypothetical protein